MSDNERTAPVQPHRQRRGESGIYGKAIPFPTRVPWVMHERAHSGYRYGQSAERMAERGGFSVLELVAALTPAIGYDGDYTQITDEMIAKVRDEAEGLAALHAEVDRLNALVSTLRASTGASEVERAVMLGVRAGHEDASNRASDCCRPFIANAKLEKVAAQTLAALGPAAHPREVSESAGLREAATRAHAAMVAEESPDGTDFDEWFAAEASALASSLTAGRGDAERTKWDAMVRAAGAYECDDEGDAVEAEPSSASRYVTKNPTLGGPHAFDPDTNGRGFMCRVCGGAWNDQRHIDHVEALASPAVVEASEGEVIEPAVGQVWRAGPVTLQITRVTATHVHTYYTETTRERWQEWLDGGSGVRPVLVATVYIPASPPATPPLAESVREWAKKVARDFADEVASTILSDFEMFSVEGVARAIGAEEEDFHAIFDRVGPPPSPPAPEVMRVAEAVRDAFVEAAEKRALEASDRADKASHGGAPLASVRAFEAESYGRNQEAAYMKITPLAPIIARVTGEKS